MGRRHKVQIVMWEFRGKKKMSNHQRLYYSEKMSKKGGSWKSECEKGGVENWEKVCWVTLVTENTICKRVYSRALITFHSQALPSDRKYMHTSACTHTNTHATGGRAELPSRHHNVSNHPPLNKQPTFHSL